MSKYFGRMLEKILDHFLPNHCRNLIEVVLNNRQELQRNVECVFGVTYDFSRSLYKIPSEVPCGFLLGVSSEILKKLHVCFIQKFFPGFLQGFLRNSFTVFFHDFS